jgi:hypothetical protein
MHRIRIMFVSLLAVLAVGAVASASASACTGLCLLQVSGKNKFGKVAISGKAIALSGGELEGDGIRVTCSTLKIEGGEVEEGSPAKGSATAAVFTGCAETTDPTDCELSSTEIRSLKITGEATSGAEFEIKETGGLLTIIQITNKSGNTCLIKGKYRITGTTKTTVTDPALEMKNHTVTLLNTGISINANSATIKGSGLLLFENSGVELNWCLLTA